MLKIIIHEHTKTCRVSEIIPDVLARTHMGTSLYYARKSVRRFLEEYFKEWDNENVPTYRFKI